ncbi:MAG: transcription-repair coupling factor [Rickettsiales bacterium]|jgi:transcription-repair coupling factor (superfamily II helicase)|nr:transcription-repair coupling factor [Rickettsiales bacterium]
MSAPIFVQENDLLSEKLDGNFLTKVIKEQNTFKPNDLVIHADYGLGKFIGLETIKKNNLENDFLKIEYKNSSFLLIPVENCDLITRYGSYNESINLDKLSNSSSWVEKKQHAKKKILEYAEQLINMDTRRRLQPAQTYSVEDNELDEFSSQCGFEATVDQNKAIGDIRKDLSSGKIMDRLLCGDVGFGKTEVALRTAFVITNSKNKGQVAIVVPTTLLCRQHYKKFIERFSITDVKIASLSRFNTVKDSVKIKKMLENGGIDIVIGTHTLLNKNIKFKNLGLVVVDEEQAFGVKQKERLKELKIGCHFLSMSATPIPRTLQMSMGGIRDFSIIATPPLNRINVETVVTKYDDEKIKRAIEFEIERNGRVFFVVPRIADIREVEMKLDILMPDLMYCSLHGQMNKDYTDKMMNDFYDGKYKLLISTTIVESGLDISFANTIIIYRANNFGLAQLYQLRGRVGRSNVQAFAYLTIKKNEVVSDLSEKRLKIIENIKTLNSGFVIASEDMDIRGAGNLLGEAQSGHVREVGIELYNQMFREAIKICKIDKELLMKDFSPEIKLGLSTAIPSDYIKNVNMKMKYYRRIADIENISDRKRIEGELIQEYGVLPQNVITLLRVSEIKILCKRLNIQKLERKDNEIWITFFHNKFEKVGELVTFVTENTGRVFLRQNGIIYKILSDEKDVCSIVKNFLEKFSLLVP